MCGDEFRSKQSLHNVVQRTTVDTHQRYHVQSGSRTGHESFLNRSTLSFWLVYGSTVVKTRSTCRSSRILESQSYRRLTPDMQKQHGWRVWTPFGWRAGWRNRYRRNWQHAKHNRPDLEAGQIFKSSIRMKTKTPIPDSDTKTMITMLARYWIISNRLKLFNLFGLFIRLLFGVVEWMNEWWSLFVTTHIQTFRLV